MNISFASRYKDLRVLDSVFRALKLIGLNVKVVSSERPIKVVLRDGSYFNFKHKLHELFSS